MIFLLIVQKGLYPETPVKQQDRGRKRKGRGPDLLADVQFAYAVRPCKYYRSKRALRVNFAGLPCHRHTAGRKQQDVWLRAIMNLDILSCLSPSIVGSSSISDALDSPSHSVLSYFGRDSNAILVYRVDIPLTG